MRKLFLLTGIVCLMSSCIRQELAPCPPLQINVAVKDKNYFNAQDAAEIVGVKDENLPFKDYVSTLYYIITEAETGKIIEERTTFEVTGSEKNYKIILPEDLPYGKYVVTAWGNLKTERPIGDDGAYEDMLSEETLNRDIYVTHDTLDYQVGKEVFQTDLERTRGLLLIQAQNVPDYVNHSAKSISNVFQYVGRKLNYAVAGTVQTDTLWNEWPFPGLGGDKKVCSHPQITRAEPGVAAAEPSRAAAFLWVSEPPGEPVPNGIPPPWKTSQRVSVAGPTVQLWDCHGNPQSS